MLPSPTTHGGFVSVVVTIGFISLSIQPWIHTSNSPPLCTRVFTGFALTSVWCNAQFCSPSTTHLAPQTVFHHSLSWFSMSSASRIIAPLGGCSCWGISPSQSVLISSRARPAPDSPIANGVCESSCQRHVSPCTPSPRLPAWSTRICKYLDFQLLSKYGCVARSRPSVLRARCFGASIVLRSLTC